MDNDLNRSVRMLEDALCVQGRSLLRTSLLDRKTPKKSRDVNVSITLSREEMERLMEGNYTMYDTTFGEFSETNESVTNLISTNKSLTGSVIRAKEPWKNTLDTLYIEFLEVLQTHTGTYEVLDIVSDLARCCSDALNVIKCLKSKVSVKYADDKEKWLENERNTWRLIYVLYQDRLNVQHQQDVEYNPYVGLSEKFCMLNLFKHDSLVRESQLIIDWVENNAADRDDDVLHFSDSTVGWENTLHQLKSKETIVFGSSRDIVTSLDPDAPIYQNKPLHDLDVEDEKRLCRRIFTEIRCGKLVEAQKLCVHCGHSWRAALLEGWKLHHNPNTENAYSHSGSEAMDEDIDSHKATSADDTKQSEGNEHRDIWKIMALQYCEQIKLDKYEKAAVAAYCGYLKVLLTVSDDWEDNLWAYMRVMVDIRVESEIRDSVNKSYRPLPDWYWDQKMSLNEIFGNLESSKNKSIQIEASKPERIIQKYLILDEIPQLVNAIEEWMEDENISSQFLRFVSHVVLFLEQIGQPTRREVVEKVLEEYIRRLMAMNESQLVAFYVSKLGTQVQVNLYSSYLEKITDDDERKQSLNFAEDCGLNVQAITKKVVENIRNLPVELDETGLQQRITASDEYKISAIDWLLFYESQKPEALIQSNALIFTFLTIKKIDAAQIVFNKIPVDSVEKILSEGEVSEAINQAIKEHLSYKSYLDAQEAFNVWFKHFKSKPLPPENISGNAHLTEKVAHQHRMSQFKADMERWKLTTAHLAKSTKMLLYNVLLFPNGGWLNGAKDSDFLRSTCIPECVLLLYTVLFESALYNECVQLADILASEKYGLYKVYNKENLGEILGKLNETSIALLNEKKDPWGNDTAT